ncbi:hypothetical protein [Moorena sp. SIO3A2]|nr:hypothetical protein [Moorena sp. SIO3A2]NER88489.1 hypothetical protein [Moorena sp. SIO3A2]
MATLREQPSTTLAKRPRYANNLQPVNLQPVNLQPVNLQPVNLQPVNLQPVNLQPVNHQPVNHQPVNLGQKATLRVQPYLPIASSYPYFRQSVSAYTIFWL